MNYLKKWSCLDINKILNTFLMLILISSCATDSGIKTKLSLSGNWNLNGLSDMTTNNFNLYNGQLYAATDSGLYKTQLNDQKNEWITLGLQNEEVINVVFLPEKKLLAAVSNLYINEGLTTMYLSVDEGNSWKPWMHNFGGESGEYTTLNSIGAPSKPSKIIFTGANGFTIARSLDCGVNWEVVQGQWNLVGGFMAFIQHDPAFSDRMWTGGGNAFLWPTLFKSTNKGETWTNLGEGIGVIGPNHMVETVVESLISHPDNPNHLLVSCVGGVSTAVMIRKSTDGGQTWSTVFEDAGIYTFTYSAKNPEIIYASGINAQQQLFFIASADFGDTWKTVEFAESPTQIHVNDMVSVMEDGKETIFFGTNKGVYSYTFEE